MRLSYAIVALALVGCDQTHSSPSIASPAAPVALNPWPEPPTSNDWNAWQARTACYRTALKARLDTLPPTASLYEGRRTGANNQFAPLAPLDDFPFFEVGAKIRLGYLLQESDPTPAIAAASRWLRARGVGLFLVTVPTLTEVCPEHFLAEPPLDGVINPSILRCQERLVHAGVDSLDPWSMFRLHRAEPLYYPADTHWSPVGQRLVARELAHRLERYGFQRTSKVRLSNRQASLRENGEPSLTGAQLEQARGVAIDRPLVEGAESDPASPVLTIGDSFVEHFQDYLAADLGLAVRSGWSPNSTTEAFADFLREPTRLAGVRVIVWVMCRKHLAELKPLPPAIAGD